MPGRTDPDQTNAALRARLEAAASQIEPPNRARVARLRARLLREVRTRVGRAGPRRTPIEVIMALLRPPGSRSE